MKQNEASACREIIMLYFMWHQNSGKLNNCLELDLVYKRSTVAIADPQVLTPFYAGREMVNEVVIFRRARDYFVSFSSIR